MFRRMIETTCKVHIVDHIVQTGIYHHACNIDGIGNSSMTTWSVIVSTMATTTSTSIIAIIIIITAAVGGIKLSVVTLALASVIILLSPSHLLRTSIWFFYHCIGPCRVYSLCWYLYSSHYGNNCFIFILFFLFGGGGG